MKRIISIITALLLIFALFAGCTAQSGGTTSTGAETSTAATTAASDTTGDDEMFTDRDLEIGYSESDSTMITLSDGATDISGNGAAAEDNTITISEEGTYILTGSLSSGQIIVDAADDAKIQLVLNGADITNESSAAIYVKNADKVFITTASGSENSLSVTGEFVAIDDNNIDGAIFAKSDLTLNGAGTLTIVSKYGHGVVSKDDLAVTSGTYDITSASSGLSGKDSVRIADGTFTIEAGTDGIHSENEDDTTLGFVYISGGSITIAAGDDGIHAEPSATILGGTISITKSYEGIEGLAIDISGGDISVVSSDDGLNAAGGNDQSGGTGGGGMGATDGAYISISGGTLTINASGDGIDSNGDLTVSGGTTTVSGPTDSGNGTIDYAGTASVTGGTLLGAGSSGMAEGFGESSTQGSILYNLTNMQQAGTKVTLKDASGNVIAEFTPAKQFQSVNISVPELVSSSTYTLVVGSEEYSIELTSTVYSNGGGMGGNMGGGQSGGQQPQGGSGGSPGGGGQAPQGNLSSDATSSATVAQ